MVLPMGFVKKSTLHSFPPPTPAIPRGLPDLMVQVANSFISVTAGSASNDWFFLLFMGCIVMFLYILF